jgi:hypothetical protein
MIRVANGRVLVCCSALGKERSEANPVAREASMATYDEMSPADRRNLFEGLASLSGLHEGPKNALPNGTRYEYDPVLKRRGHPLRGTLSCDLGRRQAYTRFGKDRPKQGEGWF